MQAAKKTLQERAKSSPEKLVSEAAAKVRELDEAVDRLQPALHNTREGTLGAAKQKHDDLSIQHARMVSRLDATTGIQRAVVKQANLMHVACTAVADVLHFRPSATGNFDPLSSQSIRNALSVICRKDLGVLLVPSLNDAARLIKSTKRELQIRVWATKVVASHDAEGNARRDRAHEELAELLGQNSAIARVTDLVHFEDPDFTGVKNKIYGAWWVCLDRTAQHAWNVAVSKLPGNKRSLVRSICVEDLSISQFGSLTGGAYKKIASGATPIDSIAELRQIEHDLSISADDVHYFEARQRKHVLGLQIAEARKKLLRAEILSEEMADSARTCRNKIDALTSQEKILQGQLLRLKKHPQVSFDRGKYRSAKQCHKQEQKVLLDAQRTVESLERQLSSVKMRLHIGDSKESIRSIQGKIASSRNNLVKLQQAVEQASRNRASLTNEEHSLQVFADEAHRRHAEIRFAMTGAQRGLRRLLDGVSLTAGMEIAAGSGNLDDLDAQIEKLQIELKSSRGSSVRSNVSQGNYLENLDALETHLESIVKGSVELRRGLSAVQKSVADIQHVSLTRIDGHLDKLFKSCFPSLSLRLSPISPMLIHAGTGNGGSSAGFADLFFWIKSLNGHWVKGLHQLSGGQQTLVGLCVMLACALADPSKSTVSTPVVLLDEVDAALDEDNSAKAAKLVAQVFTNRSARQVICVSHRAPFQRAADRTISILKAGKGGESAVKEVVDVIQT